MKTKIAVLIFLFCGLCTYSQENETRALDIGSGYFLGDEQISEKAFEKRLSVNALAYKEYKTGKTFIAAGTILAGLSAGYLGWGIGADKIGAAGYVAGGIGFVGGIVGAIIGKSKINNSLEIYNSSKGQIVFNLGAQSNGAGLTISF